MYHEQEWTPEGKLKRIQPYDGEHAKVGKTE